MYLLNWKQYANRMEGSRLIKYDTH